MKRAGPGILPVIAVDRASPAPLHRQIYQGYRDAIVEGRLRAGQPLLSTRSLSGELGVSRIPVLAAFEQLVAEGYLESRVGAGTFVARSLPDELSLRPQRVTRRRAGGRPGRRNLPRLPEVLLRTPPAPPAPVGAAFRVGQPALEDFPFRVWARLVARHSRNPRASWLGYGEPMGHPPFREAVASYLRTARAVRCEADQVMVTSGSQQALQIAARALLEPGAPVWVEEPGYFGARDVLLLAGARLVPVPVDDEGLDVAEGIRRSPRAHAAYVTPSHQYPLGSTMSAARRLQLLDWAQAAGAWVIEDDYDSEYRYESLPVAALQGLDRDDRVLYVGTFSKVLFPALRLGYLVVPPDLVPRFAAIREAMDVFPPTFSQAVLADFIGEGHFGRHLRRMRELYRERRSVLVECLGKELGAAVRVEGAQAGMHLVTAMARGTRDRAISARAERRGVRALPLSECYLGAPARAGLVLGYGGTRRAEIPAAVRRLREAFETTA